MGAATSNGRVADPERVRQRSLADERRAPIPVWRIFLSILIVAQYTLIWYIFSMILSFGNQTTEDIFHGDNTKTARRIPPDLWRVARRKLDMLNAAHELRDLMVPPGNRLEGLKGQLAAFHSIRINDQFRVIFKWADGNVHEVQIADYH